MTEIRVSVEVSKCLRSWRGKDLSATTKIRAAITRSALLTFAVKTKRLRLATPRAGSLAIFATPVRASVFLAWHLFVLTGF